MSEPVDFDAAVTSMFQAVGGAIDAMRYGLDRYEYKLVGADELNEHGADRWRVAPVPAVQEVKVVLGQAKPGPLTFLMERQLLAADEDLGQISAPEG